MKITLKQLIATNNIAPSLIRAVVKQIGGIQSFNASWSDIVNYGIGGGFSGFIYYSDTVKFYEKNKSAIWDLLTDLANDLGESPVEMVANFGCLKSFDQSDIIEFMVKGKKAEYYDNIANGLSWFAAEEVVAIAADFFDMGE